MADTHSDVIILEPENTGGQEAQSESLSEKTADLQQADACTQGSRAV